MSLKTISLTNREVFGLYNNLSSLKMEKPPIKFVSWVSKNLIALEKAYTEIDKSRRIQDEGLKEREKLLNTEIRKKSLEVSKIATEQKEYEKKTEVEKALVLEAQNAKKVEIDLGLKEEFEDVYEEYERISKEMEEYFEEKRDIEVCVISENKLPKNLDTLESTKYLSFLIED